MSNFKKLTHPEPGYTFYLDLDRVVAMERYTHPTYNGVIQLDEKQPKTALVLMDGRILACKETPEQILELMKSHD